MTKDTELNRDLIMMSMSKFYGTMANVEKLESIRKGTSPISLRLLDWFVTRYCKQHSADSPECADIYNNYRTQLKAYSKTNFDPFRRGDLIRFHVNSTTCISTTVGQLNFYRWACEKRDHRPSVIEIIEPRVSELNSKMIASQKERAPRQPKPHTTPLMKAEPLRLPKRPTPPSKSNMDIRRVKKLAFD
jgi:hypothetical protein